MPSEMRSAGPPHLTTAELLAMPSGSRVWVTWSGGNGPHEYEVRNTLYADGARSEYAAIYRIGARPLERAVGFISRLHPGPPCDQAWASDPRGPR